MPDTSLGITYPASGGHGRLWEHFQTFADDVNTLLLRKGYIADSARTSSSANVTTTETVIQSLTFNAVAGTRYKVTALQSVQSTAAGDSCIVRTRWATGATVTTGGTQIDSKIIPSYTAALGFLATSVGTFVASSTGQVTVGVTLARNTGLNTWSSFGNSSQINTILVEGV
ncbi:hypothetical protein KBX03_07560 [Micromonospora sp. C72]|uniref:DUF7298 domain-containing protein n=1 Tax=Micromonospora sp. C72 TaxID=2824880 RepID=UPI001B36E465|nr:hypothetical protein [Micromonospora sp. C72]MBQ1042360.1 hypothetical protein [Micromonospora sp. C72]